MRTALQGALKDAMRAQDRAKADTIRQILSALQYEEMQRGVDQLPDPVAIEVLQREVKKRREELEYAEKAGRTDLSEGIKKEMDLLEGFLPQQLDPARLEQVIQEIHAQQNGANMGAVMKVLKERYPGQYDARLASEIAKRVCG